jgi:hypothetical protein
MVPSATRRSKGTHLHRPEVNVEGSHRLLRTIRLQLVDLHLQVLDLPSRAASSCRHLPRRLTPGVYVLEHGHPDSSFIVVDLEHGHPDSSFIVVDLVTMLFSFKDH